MPKVSVIIPVYGVEKYIERCARSLFEQTLDDIEFIFIDDCTPDNSIGVLKEVINDYQHRVSQIIIERMPQNSGLPRVRKKGVDLATGDYIIACDSDDYVEKEMYKTMLDEAVNNQLDLVQCDIDVVDDSHVINTFTSPEAELTSGRLKELIIQGEISNSLCNKLVKKEVYHCEHITFPTVGMDEDNALAIQLAFFCDKLGYVRKPFYKAYCNRLSISRAGGIAKVQKQFNESLENSKLIIGFLSSHGYNENSMAVIRAKVRPKQIIWRSHSSVG